MGLKRATRVQGREEETKKNKKGKEKETLFVN